MNPIKQFLKETIAYDVVQGLKILNWERNGKPLPPPNKVKHNTIKAYAQKFSIHTLVETGTYLGDTIYACRNSFEKIYSIDLSIPLHEKAKKRFAGFSHITLLLGDSTTVLLDVIPQLQEPTLFWLDAHYCGGITGLGDLETPIWRELEAIFNHHITDHVILIDDARLFQGKNDYPTVEEIHNWVVSRRSHWVFEVADDIMVIHKP
mgnify:FL=1